MSQNYLKETTVSLSSIIEFLDPNKTSLSS